MNRRGFLTQMLRAGVGAMILPGAGRLWKPTIKPIRFVQPTLIVPFWFQTHRDKVIVSDAYQRAFADMFFHNKPIPEHLIPKSTAIIDPIVTFRESPGGPGTHPDFLKALKADIAS